MRRQLILLAAQWTLALCASILTKDYVVGAKAAAERLFLRVTDQWQHIGYNHPFIVAMDYDPCRPTPFYLAAGNGLFRATKRGTEWTQLTGSDVTELRDLAVDPTDSRTVYFAYCHGIRVTHDRGVTWEELAIECTGASLRRFADRTRHERLIVGGEEGIFRSEDGGKSWTLAGASGFQILRLEQSPHDPSFWLGATQGGGLFSHRMIAARRSKP